MSSIEQVNVENEFKLIIRKKLCWNRKNIEMDLKNYSSDKDLLEYFFEKINLCSSENFEKFFQIINLNSFSTFSCSIDDIITIYWGG